MLKHAKTITALAVGVLLVAGLPPVAADAAPAGDMLVNGDFEYPGYTMLNSHWQSDWWTVSPDDHTGFNGGAYTPMPADFDPTRFAWHSTETDGPDNPQRHAGEVELQRDRTGNMYAELCAYEAGTSIYQDVRTQPGAAYTIRLRHASLSSAYVDKMQVLADGRPVVMTRVSSNGHGDRIGERSSTVATRVSNTNNRDHSAQWETYESDPYIATGSVTRFSFRSVDSRSPNSGNLLDDLSFTVSHPLRYHPNGGAGTLPKEQS